MAENAMTWGEPASSDDKTWALVAHLSCFVLPWIGSIAMYLVFKDRPFVRYHAVQSLVVQAAVIIIATLTCGLGLVLFLLPLYGAYVAYEGRWDGYPLIGGIGR